MNKIIFAGVLSVGLVAGVLVLSFSAFAASQNYNSSKSNTAGIAVTTPTPTVLAGLAGDPIPGVDVSVEQSPSGIIIQQVKTDNVGNFALTSSLPPGNYLLRARRGQGVATGRRGGAYEMVRPNFTPQPALASIPNLKVLLAASQNYNSSKSNTAGTAVTTPTPILLPGGQTASQSNVRRRPVVYSSVQSNVATSLDADGKTVVKVTIGLFTPPGLGAPVGSILPGIVRLTNADLGVADVGTLPTSHFYFLKQWGRGLSRVSTFDPVAKAQLELNITNQIAAEALEVDKNSPNDAAALKKAIQNYTDAQDRLNARLATLPDSSQNPNVAKLLEDVKARTVKHAALLDQLIQGHADQQNYQDISDVVDNAQNNIQSALDSTFEPIKFTVGPKGGIVFGAVTDLGPEPSKPGENEQPQVTPTPSSSVSPTASPKPSPTPKPQATKPPTPTPSANCPPGLTCASPTSGSTPTPTPNETPTPTPTPNTDVTFSSVVPESVPADQDFTINGTHFIVGSNTKQVQAVRLNGVDISFFIIDAQTIFATPNSNMHGVYDVTIVTTAGQNLTFHAALTIQ